MITPQNAIAKMMSEDSPYSTGLMGTTSLISPQAITINPMGNGSGEEDVYDQQNDQEFSQEELTAAASFVKMIGGDPEKAKQLIDRCNECSDCLGLDDEDDDFDTRTIESIAIEAPEYE